MRDRLDRIEERISDACERVGRRRDEVRLMAVGKRQPDQKITEALEIGLRFFGESLVQETKARFARFPKDAEVHLIGHLQRNKAKDAVRMYRAVQSIDSERTVEALSSQLEAIDRTIDIYVEINSSGESSKYGLTTFDAVERLVGSILKKPMLQLRGLMTIGPLTDDESKLRRAFTLVRTFRDRLCDRYPEQSFSELSMGMSNDLESAIMEGSTQVRIGTALFGPRVG